MRYNTSMLDIKYIRENPEVVKKAIFDKNLTKTIDLEEFLELDKKYTDLLRQVELKRSLRNQLSENIAKIKEQNEKTTLLTEAKTIKEDLGRMEEDLKNLKGRIDQMLLWIPNPPAEDVPYGQDEKDNKILREEGEPKQFSFKPRNHMELGSMLDIIDTERGVKLAGFRGYFLKNEGMQLHHALMRYALDLIKSKGFDLYDVPWMVRPDYFVGTGYFPWGEEDHYVTQDGMCLIGTAEVSLTSYHANEVLDEKALPIKLAGVSPCYRREIGSYGQDTKGVFRVHQFMKVEQVVLLPEGEELSREWHDKMLSYSEELLKNLDLSYRVILMCTGDMGAGQRKKYDLETWFPSQETYRETHSDSYFLDYQARRLNIRYKSSEGKLKYVSTLNNTVAASPRLLAAVLETYQTEEGSVAIPEVLNKYLDFEKIEPKK